MANPYTDPIEGEPGEALRIANPYTDPAWGGSKNGKPIYRSCLGRLQGVILAPESAVFIRGNQNTMVDDG